MTSSIAGVTGGGSSVAYAASKGALNTMTLSLARALAPKIRVNAICPGFMDTRWFSDAYDKETAQRLRDNIKNTTPLQVVSTAEDVADAALFLISDAARRITGETLLVDAGQHLGFAPLRARGRIPEIRCREFRDDRRWHYLPRNRLRFRAPRSCGHNRKKKEPTMSTIHPSPFLRNVLLLDAAASGATGLLLIAGAGLLDGLLGLPVALMREAGLILVPYVAFVAWVGTREAIVRGAVWAIIAANALWAIASIGLLVSGLVAPTLLGYAFVIAQAAVVALLGELQYAGLKRQATVAA